MNSQDIFQSLSQISPITLDSWAHLEELLGEVSLDRNEYLVRDGERTHHVNLLTEGVIRVFYNKGGTEYNKTFFIPGMFPTAITSLLSDNPSQLSFQALTSARLIRFPYKKFRALFEEHRCLETFMLRVLEIEWINKERHDIQMVTNDATTNYLIFRENYPNLENLIPQYHIASYLGITPIQLSRIRSQLTKSS
jgi:CRP-like cAMP-binding protein